MPKKISFIYTNNMEEEDMKSFYQLIITVTIKKKKEQIYLVYIIAWAQGQLWINFTCIFKVFPK